MGTVLKRGHGLDIATVTAVSNDGKTFLGGAGLPDGTSGPVLFGRGDRYVALPAPDGAPAPSTVGMSGDGKIVLCTDAPQSSPFHPRPYLVKDNVATYLPLPNGATEAQVSAISADGTTVVGAVGGKPVRWVNGGAPETLGTQDGEAHAVNRDGTVVVGLLFQPDVAWKPFRWTAARGVQDLPVAAGFSYGQADGVSADGKAVIIDAKTFDSAPYETSFLWKESIGTLPLADVFAAAGGDATLFNGIDVSAISADGRTIVGRGTKRADGTGSSLGAWKLLLP